MINKLKFCFPIKESVCENSTPKSKFGKSLSSVQTFSLSTRIILTTRVVFSFSRFRCALYFLPFADLSCGARNPTMVGAAFLRSRGVAAGNEDQEHQEKSEDDQLWHGFCSWKISLEILLCRSILIFYFLTFSEALYVQQWSEDRAFDKFHAW